MTAVIIPYSWSKYETNARPLWLSGQGGIGISKGQSELSSEYQMGALGRGGDVAVDGFDGAGMVAYEARAGLDPYPETDNDDGEYDWEGDDVPGVRIIRSVGPALTPP